MIAGILSGRAPHSAEHSPSLQALLRQELGGILGGMGPAATVDFLDKLVRLTPASRDQDHIPVVVFQSPQIPDRSTAVLAGQDDPFEPMLNGLRALRRCGATYAAIPCNTAHYWHARLEQASGLEILHIARAVADELARYQPLATRIGLMATQGTIRGRIYEDAIRSRNGELVVPRGRTQALIDASIGAVKSGQHSIAQETAEEAAAMLLAEGADVLILGCTELPLALAGSALSARCVDSTLALARQCIARGLGVGRRCHA